MAPKKKKAARLIRGSGVGVTISYKPLHREIARLNRQLKAVKRKRRSAGLALNRVNHVLQSLQACRSATQCQVNMLEGY